MRLVQMGNGAERRVALVDEPNLRSLVDVGSVYKLACRCIEVGESMTRAVQRLVTNETHSYDAIYNGSSKWRLLVPVDVPNAPSHTLVSGTGLTHLGSAQQRQAMHLADKKVEVIHQDDAALTDSMKMFRWGLERGRPAEGGIGVAPEWFYKGDGSCIRAHNEPLDIPAHAEDGGEEAELAGVYLISNDGIPFRIGMVQGNEFSDHVFEKQNYLNLAGSKLRTCSIGPEFVIEPEFKDIKGEVRIDRKGATLWEKSIASGEGNMCHSLANLEHHHFKFAGHRQPGMLHVHFFGAGTLSFSEGITLQNGDIAEVSFKGFGRTLRNPIYQESKQTEPMRVRILG